MDEDEVAKNKYVVWWIHGRKYEVEGDQKGAKNQKIRSKSDMKGGGSFSISRAPFLVGNDQSPGFSFPSRKQGH